MSSGGGKSGSETTETTLPDWLQQPVQRNLQRAEDLQRMPFMPYRGPEVAAFNPNQVAAFQNNNDAARAFGFNAPTDAMGGLIQPSKYADGSFGYDSNSLYDQALLDTQAYDPAAYNKYQSFFDTSVGNNTTTLPTGNPSAGGGGGGGGGRIDPNAVMLQKLRDDRANAVTPPVNYDTSGSGSNPFGYQDDPSVSPGFDNSRRNFTPSSPAYQPSLTGTTMDDTAAIQAGMTPQLSSRFDRVGATPQSYSASPDPVQRLMAERADAMERSRLASLGISVGK